MAADGELVSAAAGLLSQSGKKEVRQAETSNRSRVNFPPVVSRCKLFHIVLSSFNIKARPSMLPGVNTFVLFWVQSVCVSSKCHSSSQCVSHHLVLLEELGCVQGLLDLCQPVQIRLLRFQEKKKKKKTQKRVLHNFLSVHK